DNNAVDDRGHGLYTERFLHGEIYKVRPDVVAICHCHAPPVIPFGVIDVPLKPMYHRAAFIALGVPIFEIRDAAGMTDLLIRNPARGAARERTIWDKPAVLMRGHGATVVAPSLPRLVGRSIFLALNATLQAQAMIMTGGGAINYLDPEEARLIEAREGYGLGRAWEAWKRKALKSGGRGPPRTGDPHPTGERGGAPPDRDGQPPPEGPVVGGALTGARGAAQLPGIVGDRAEHEMPVICHGASGTE